MRRITLPDQNHPAIKNCIPRFCSFFSYNITDDRSIKRGRLRENLESEAQGILRILNYDVSNRLTPDATGSIDIAWRARADPIIAAVLVHLSTALRESPHIYFELRPPNDPTLFAYALASTRREELGGPGVFLHPDLEPRRNEIVDIVDIAISIFTYKVIFEPNVLGILLLACLPVALLLSPALGMPAIAFIAAVALYGFCEWLYVNHFNLLDVVAKNIRETSSPTLDDSVNGFDLGMRLF
jgi:hypothetical protein